MKALLLAGGRGKRLDDLSAVRNKSMTIINGRPAIEYNLQYAINAGVEEIVIVVGYRAEDIINYLGNRYHDVAIRYVIQKEQKGLVHAIECARETIGQNDFMLMLADEIMKNPHHKEMISEYKRSGAFALCGILTVENRNLIKKTYTLIQDSEGRIFRLIEKPRNPLNQFMGTGDCVFNNKIFDYIEYTPIHHERKEKELPDLIQCAIDDGMDVRSFLICDKYVNINTKEDIQMAEEFMK